MRNEAIGKTFTSENWKTCPTGKYPPGSLAFHLSKYPVTDGKRDVFVSRRNIRNNLTSVLTGKYHDKWLQVDGTELSLSQ